MGPHFFTLVLVVVLSSKGTSEKILEMVGLRDKADVLLRTWFPEDPHCHPEKCPKQSSKDWSRLNKRCCEDTGTFFHCQKTDAKLVMSFCMSAIPCPAGTFADLEVIKMRNYPKEPLCQECPSLEFQPTQTVSYMFRTPHCHHKRRLCHAVNADNVVFGNADTDDVCRCPHYLNYRPVPLADNDCMLFNSSSRCKCEYQPCPEGQIMTETGYQCMDATLAKTLDSFHLAKSDNLLQGNTGLEARLCLGKDCSNPLTHANWFNSLQDLHRSYGLCVPAFLFIVAYLIYQGLRCLWVLIFKASPDMTCTSKYAGPTRYDILVCIIIPSSKVCEFVFEEIENSLPLLEKLYGPLTLDHDEDFTYITVIVRPRLAKTKFSLMQFIQDLFSSVSITKYLHGASEAEEIQIVAVHGSSKDVAKASFKDAALKQRHSTLTFHTGEAILRFTDAADEAAVLRDLKSAKGDLRSLFRLYNLKFLHVRQGSIKFRFSFPAQADSFNSLAAEERIKEFVKHLCSYDSFNELTKRQDVTVEFLCRAKLNAVSVVQAQYLYVQVGNQNNVYISDHQPQALDNDMDDDETLEYDEYRPEKREFMSFNVISISPRNQAIHNEGDRLAQEEDNQIGEVDPNSDAIPVLIKCEESTAEELFTEWTNSLPLFRRIYPSCQLKRARSGVLWELHSTHWTYFCVTDFIADLFLTDRLKDIKSRCHLQIDVPVSNLTAGAVGISTKLHEQKEDTAKVVKEGTKLLRYILIMWLFFLAFATLAGKEESSFLGVIVTLVSLLYVTRYFIPCWLQILKLSWRLLPSDDKMFATCLFCTFTQFVDVSVWYFTTSLGNNTTNMK